MMDVMLGGDTLSDVMPFQFDVFFFFFPFGPYDEEKGVAILPHSPSLFTRLVFEEGEKEEKRRRSFIFSNCR